MIIGSDTFFAGECGDTHTAATEPQSTGHFRRCVSQKKLPVSFSRNIPEPNALRNSIVVSVDDRAAIARQGLFLAVAYVLQELFFFGVRAGRKAQLDLDVMRFPFAGLPCGKS